MESENANLDVVESSTAAPKTLKFEFKGDGTEYFKIWIVNVLLTIITFGIYSAWAKVRNNRYFYSNLYLDGSNFRYLAEPLTILKGRIIAVIAFAIYSYVSTAAPTVGIALGVALILAIPYFVNQSLAFNNRMSAYRNIQFRFKASYGEAFMVLYVWPTLGMLTLGILYPLAFLKLNQYIVRNSSYGTTNFDFHATYKDYGMIFLIILGVGVMAAALVAVIVQFVPFVTGVMPLVLMVLYFGLILYFIVSTTNLYYRSLTIKDHEFDATLDISSLGLVFLKNALLVAVTFGLYLPAAKVRMTKYMAENIVMEAKGSLDDFAAAEQENISALGEEFGQVFDFGLS